jgi:hypothetical protein
MLNFYFHEDFDISTMRCLYYYLTDSGFQYSEIPSSNHLSFNFSFDDNYLSWLKLCDLGFNVTFYLNTYPFYRSCDLKKYLSRINKPLSTKIMTTASDIQLLLSSGHRFGFHTHTHIKVSNESNTTLINEINNNRIFFHDLGILNPVNQFAVPYGMLRFVNKSQLSLLLKEFDSISFANPGMLGFSNSSIIHRIDYLNNKSLMENIRRAHLISPFIFRTGFLNIDTL